MNLRIASIAVVRPVSSDSSTSSDKSAQRGVLLCGVCVIKRESGPRHMVGVIQLAGLSFVEVVGPAVLELLEG
jgi:hypothetical protein